MKSSIFIFFFSFFFSVQSQSIISNADHIKSEFKKLMVVQSLISENRSSELKQFIDGNFNAFDDGRFATKYDSESPYSFITKIETDSENKKYLAIRVLNTERDGMELTLNDKKIIYQGIINLFHQPGFPKLAYYNMLESIQNLAKKEPDVSIEIINDYSFKYTTPGEQMEIMLSNYAVSNGENAVFLYFFGPGRGDLKITLPTTNEILYEEGFYTLFIETIDISDNRKPVNKEFFLALTDFNDRIWSDN